jgi:hypothetical protein
MTQDTPDSLAVELRSTSAELRQTAVRLRAEARVKLHLTRLSRLDLAVRVMRRTLARLRQDRSAK